MTPRNLIILLAIFVLVALGLWVAWLNPDPVTFRLPGFPVREYSPPLWVVSFLSILVGVFVSMVYLAVLSSRDAFVRWRRRLRERGAFENHRVLLQGLEAAVEGDDGRALELFEQVVTSDPDQLDGWLLGGAAARRLGELDRAVDMHMRARGLAPDEPRVHEALAADFSALGEAARAVGHLEQRLSHERKGDPAILAWLRDLLAQQGRWDEAIDAQQKRLKLTRDPAVRADEEAILRGLRLEKGRQLLDRGGDERRKEAGSIFSSLIKADPEFVPAHLLLGETRLAQGDEDAAIKAWQQGVETSHSLPLLDHLVDFYLEAGQPESALKVYQRAVDNLEGDNRVEARLGQALLYARLEMIDEARAAFEELEEASEYSLTLRYFLGRIRQRLGDDVGAAAAFQEVIDAAGILERRYKCEHCGNRHEDYRIRCPLCQRWGTIVQDTSHDVRVNTETGVHAPRV